MPSSPADLFETLNAIKLRAFFGEKRLKNVTNVLNIYRHSAVALLAVSQAAYHLIGRFKIACFYKSRLNLKYGNNSFQPRLTR